MEKSLSGCSHLMQLVRPWSAGAGTGLVGLLAARGGAERVFLTDVGANVLGGVFCIPDAHTCMFCILDAHTRIFCRLDAQMGHALTDASYVCHRMIASMTYVRTPRRA